MTVSRDFLAVLKVLPQSSLRRHLIGLAARRLAGRSLKASSTCLRAAKAVARLCICTGSPEPLPLAYAFSTIYSWTGLNIINKGSLGYQVYLDRLIQWKRLIQVEKSWTSWKTYLKLQNSKSSSNNLDRYKPLFSLYIMKAYGLFITCRGSTSGFLLLQYSNCVVNN